MKEDDSDSSSPADTSVPPVEPITANTGRAPPTKTPMYQALNAARYHRQEQIRRIQDVRDTRLISYVSGIANAIDREDVLGFGDLLHNVRPNENLDLLLHTPGGDIDAAEKLITMVRTRVGSGRLRVIVPDFAKSAGTLMALGADIIIMSDTSELGPIDPQITLRDGYGNPVRHSVQTYLDAYNTHAEALRKEPGDVAERLMLSKLDPAILKLCRAASERAQRFAEEQLKFGMFRSGQGGNFTKIASDLMDSKRWLSHGQMIGAADAAKIGLNVEYLEISSSDWQGYWHLYCLQRLAVGLRLAAFRRARIDAHLSIGLWR